MNKAKRKLLISVLVMTFILISVVATVAIIFAATQQTITTTLNMTYTAENIYGSVKGSYSLGGVTENLTASTGGTDLVFQGKPLQNGALSFPTEQLDMSSEASELILKYDFTNSGRRHYIATMSFESVLEPYNMKVQYSIDGDIYSDQRYAVVVQDDTTRSYWIKISVDNKADNASFKGDFIWNLEDTEDMDEATYLSLSTLEFQGSDGAYSASISEAGDFVGAITFPSEVNGDKVTTISSSSLSDADKAKVTSVYIPDSVETIGNSAFKNFTNLEEVIFEQNEAAGSSGVSAQSTTGLKTIGNDAFNGCKSLNNFQMPNTVTSIGMTSFYGCTGLTSVIISDSVTSIGVMAFGGCTGLTSVIIGSGVTGIGTSQFYGCTGLTSITVASGNAKYHSLGNCIIETASKTLIKGCKTSVIPADVTSIGDMAFMGCLGLTNIEIPASVTSIMGDAFSGCKGLTSIEIPASVTSIGSHAFGGCTNLKNVTLHTLNSSVISTIKELANTNGEMNLTIDTVDSIPNDAFDGCTGLKNVTIGNSITNIGYHAFNNCANLTSLILSNKLTTITDDFLDGCTSLTSIIIPASVTTIRTYAFSGASSLTSIIFENKIGWKAGSTSITEAQLEDSANAALLLKDTYKTEIWTRSE